MKLLNKKTRIMHFKMSFRIICVFICLLLSCPLTVFAELDKPDQLRQKMADLSLLQEQFNERRQETIETRELIYEQMKQLIKEIIDEQEQLNITSFKTAINQPRIKYNLMLIQQIIGFIASFDKKIVYYKIGNDKLDYLHKQADDDLQIVTTLSDMRIEALTSQIEQVISVYLPEAHKVIIDPSTISYQNLESIWTKIVKNKLY